MGRKSFLIGIFLFVVLLICVSYYVVAISEVYCDDYGCHYRLVRPRGFLISVDEPQTDSCANFDPITEHCTDTHSVECCNSGLPGLEGSNCYDTNTVSECVNGGGYIVDCVAQNNNVPPLPVPVQCKGPARVISPYSVANTINYADPFIIQLKNDIHAAGIYNTPEHNKYIKNVYDCKNFSSNLSEYLRLKGYNSTITVIRWASDTITLGGWRNGHMLVDIHDNRTNKTYFIEPQKDPLTDNVFRKLDTDNDGILKVWKSLDLLYDICISDQTSDGRKLYEIDIYNSVEDAKNHNVFQNFNP